MANNKPKELVAIYRQEIIKDVSLFTSQPKARFYDKLFLSLEENCFKMPHAKTGRKSQKEALLCAFIVMKCEGFSQMSDLVDYLNNNLIIAHYCGFNLSKKLPSYWTFERFIKNLDNNVLKETMKALVLKLSEDGIVDTSFLGLDSTPNSANTSQNNPKTFAKNKFCKDNQPRADKDCSLGVRTASNQHNERNYEFYWGYKNHVLCDCITGLPLYELTTAANAADSSVALDILRETNAFLPISECYFIADKGYDAKNIYNTIKNTYGSECFIPINQRNTKIHNKLPVGNPICDAGLAMHRDGKFNDRGLRRQKFCCPFKRSNHIHDCPCNHRNFKKGSKTTGCTKYISFPDDYRLSINRHSIEFKSVYRLRTECERYNSRFKSTGQERLWVRNLNSVKNLNSIAHLSLLAIAVAAVVTKSNVSFRRIKTVKRIA